MSTLKKDRQINEFAGLLLCPSLKFVLQEMLGWVRVERVFSGPGDIS